MTTKLKALMMGVAFLATAAAAPAGATTYVYVGSWNVFDGPVWTSNPPVYSGVEAAALLFGGNASDYAISTVDSNPANINFEAWLDGWGDTQYLLSPAAQNYSLDTGGAGYNSNPGSGSAYSAYVCDHAFCQAYGYAENSGYEGYNYTNFAFRAVVPEPSTWAMMGLGFAGLAFAGYRARRTATAVA